MALDNQNEIRICSRCIYDENISGIVFDEKGRGSHAIPLGMDYMVVNGSGKFKFAVFPSKEGRPFIF